MNWPDEIWADKLSDKHSAEPNKTIVELRTKLEIRTWILRASLAMNVALLTGLIVNVIIKLNS
jgi:hypothetical protein